MTLKLLYKTSSGTQKEFVFDEDKHHPIYVHFERFSTLDEGALEDGLAMIHYYVNDLFDEELLVDCDNGEPLQIIEFKNH